MIVGGLGHSPACLVAFGCLVTWPAALVEQGTVNSGIELCQ
jgi:hypothetical protein